MWDGELKKGSIATFLNPFSRVWKNVKSAQKAGVENYNIKGEGLIKGGLFVMKPGSKGCSTSIKSDSLVITRP